MRELERETVELAIKSLRMVLTGMERNDRQIRAQYADLILRNFKLLQTMERNIRYGPAADTPKQRKKVSLAYTTPDEARLVPDGGEEPAEGEAGLRSQDQHGKSG